MSEHLERENEGLRKALERALAEYERAERFIIEDRSPQPEEDLARLKEEIAEIRGESS